jgi:hypothetical protein
MIEEREPEKVNPEKDHQIHEHQLPCEYVEEEHFVETHHVENLIHEEALHEDKAPILSPLFNEFIQASIHLPHEEENMVTYTPFQVFDVASFHVSKREEVLEEPLDALDPSCYEKGSDTVDNIDEFIHVGMRKWDVIGSNEDPIYDIEGHFQKLPLQLSYEVTNFDNWQQGDGMFTNFFQTPKDDWCYILLVIFGHTLRILIIIPMSTWIYSMKNIMNHHRA